jgi:ABC-type sugar transport system substrate-binding protein
VVAADSAEWMTEPAQKKTEAMLNAHPNIKGIFCAHDMMAMGAIQAIASAGKAGQVVVAGYDDIEAARQAIRSGAMYATIEQHPDMMGAMGIENAIKAIKGEQLPAVIKVPTELVTAKQLESAPTK